jgi:hypothetical protein
MSVIDARYIDGKYVFRLWSTIVDAYLTNELSEDEVRRALKQEYIRAAADSCVYDTEGRLGRAKRQGTSDLVGERPGLEAAWRNNDKPGVALPDFRHMYFLVAGEKLRTSIVRANIVESVVLDKQRYDEFARWAAFCTEGDFFQADDITIVRVTPQE